MSEIETSPREVSSPRRVRAPSRRRVVITGLGIVNPLGVGLEAFRQGLEQGRSGIKPIQSFDASKLPTRFGGEVTDFNAKSFIDKKERKNLRVMARSIQLAVGCAQLTMEDSGIDKEKLDPTRFGVEFGAGLMATDLSELSGAAEVSANCRPGQVDLVKWGNEGIARIPPLWMLKYLPNMLACHVSILQNAQGPNNTITEGDAGGLLALGEAYRILQRGQADFMLAGGADSKLNPLSMVRQCLFGALSVRNDEPEKASRPFDAERDGLVISEGAGVLAVEDIEHAQARSARIYAEVIGFGAAFDAKKNGAGLAQAIRTALTQAGIGAEDLDHINAHGLSTPAADVWEAAAIRQAFGEHAGNIPIFAAKSYFGNTGAGSATSELIASLAALQKDTRLATLNYQEPDSKCPLNVQKENQPISRPCIMKISFTDMGQCAALICRKWE